MDRSRTSKQIHFLNQHLGMKFRYSEYAGNFNNSRNVCHYVLVEGELYTTPVDLRLVSIVIFIA